MLRTHQSAPSRVSWQNLAFINRCWVNEMNDFSSIQMKMKIFFWLVHICVGFFLYMSGFRGHFRIRGFFRLLLRGLRCMLNNGNIVCWTMLNWFVEKHCWNNVEDWHQRRTSFPCFFTALKVLIQIVLIMRSDDRNSHDLVDTNKVVVCKKNVACNLGICWKSCAVAF